MRRMLIPMGMVLLMLCGGVERACAESLVEVQHCLVSLISEAQVPAEEPGVLVDVKVREGQQVARDEVLAQIDDDLIQMQQKAAEYKLNVAREKASNDIHVRYAKAAAEVARASYYRRVAANKKAPGAVPEQEMEEYYLNWQKLLLEIEQAQVDLKIAALEEKVSQADVDAAVENIDRRKIKAPLDGEVVKVNRHAGEWVTAGDQVLHVIGMKRLRIEGSLGVGDYPPSQLVDRPVTVRVTLPGGRPATFEGRVVFVSPAVEASNEFLVWAEVDNRQEHGRWLLSPGLECTMTIHLQ